MEGLASSPQFLLTLVAKLGSLDRFEPIDEVHPLHVKEILEGAQLHIKLPTTHPARSKPSNGGHLCPMQ